MPKIISRSQMASYLRIAGERFIKDAQYVVDSNETWRSPQRAVKDQERVDHLERQAKECGELAEALELGDDIEWTE